jgi:hypothetical protein
MKKREVDHVLRAAGRITGEKQFIVIGSQSLHGKFPDLPDDLVKSFEVDLMASKHADRTEWLNVIGLYSPFHDSFGYYADPVDDSTRLFFDCGTALPSKPTKQIRVVKPTKTKVSSTPLQG